MADPAPPPHVGELLRAWRQRRRLTQLELSLRADVSARHLSFSRRALPRPAGTCSRTSPSTRTSRCASATWRFTAAGYALVYSETDLQAPEMDAVIRAIQRLLASHEPYPAVVVDRWWNMVAANPGEWRAHLLTRLRGQVDKTGDPQLSMLLDELRDDGESESVLEATHRDDGVVVPLRLRSSRGDLNLLSTVATFGTPVDVTVADLSVESFFPADDHTRALLQAFGPKR